MAIYTIGPGTTNGFSVKRLVLTVSGYDYDAISCLPFYSSDVVSYSDYVPPGMILHDKKGFSDSDTESDRERKKSGKTDEH